MFCGAVYPPRLLSSQCPPLFRRRILHGLIWSMDCATLEQANLWITSHSETYPHLHLHFLPAMSIQWWRKWKKGKKKNIYKKKKNIPQAQNGLNYQSATGEKLPSFVFHAAAARERAAIPLPLDWADYAQVSAAAKKADYLCPNRVVSLETQDAIISMGRVIIGDQAYVTVRCWHRMRQSLTNEGFYMCEVNKVLPLNSCALPLSNCLRLLNVDSCRFIVFWPAALASSEGCGTRPVEASTQLNCWLHQLGFRVKQKTDQAPSRSLFTNEAFRNSDGFLPCRVSHSVLVHHCSRVFLLFVCLQMVTRWIWSDQIDN